MDENKITKLNIKTTDVEKKQPHSVVSNVLQTNPILKQMFFANLVNKKDKFKLKDLFR